MIYGVILAAGVGKRMKTKDKKQFISINNKPILYYSLEKFIKIKTIDVIIIVINKKDENNSIILNLLNKYQKIIKNNRLFIVLGGKERYDSVYNSLDFIKNFYGISSKDKILIHDAARPNVDIYDIKKLINSLNKYNAVTLGYRLSDSIKRIKNIKNKPIKEVINSVNRDEYYLISTPQGFRIKDLYNAYKKFIVNKNKYKITDDLQIIEYFTKIKTYILDSSKLNYKITVQDDLNMLKYIL